MVNRKFITIPFEVNDIVWHKNLVTNEAMQATVKTYTAMIDSNGTKCVLYHLSDGSPVMNIIGKPKNTDAFATKEECDSYPPYNPNQNEFINKSN